jgi:peptide-methionine (S)-S-oxide reductase
VFGLFQSPGENRAERQGTASSPESLPHAVLGTPLGAPLAANEAEVLFGCGGFWRLPGVITTAVGYAGGQLQNPSYQQVCSGRTGHAEVVRVVWNREQLGFADLLKLFWECHDPTQGDRQGNDTGSQYRSAIYVNDPSLLELARASHDAYQQGLFQAGFGPITTEIRADVPFFFAEPYHQQYLAKPGSRPYCSAMPTRVVLGSFPGANYTLPETVWQHYDWSISHCILRGDNSPIRL